MSTPEIAPFAPFAAPAPPRAASSSTGAWVAAALVIAVSLLSTFTISTDDSSNVSAAGGVPGGNYPVDPDTGQVEATAATGGGTTRRVVGGGGGTAGVAGTEGQSATEGGSQGTQGAQGGQGGAGGNADCAKDENAGESDVGVSGNEIRFAATVVKTGVAKDFLSDAQWGMEAVLRKVNAGTDDGKGGVCGRRISVKYDDDGWDLAKGGGIIKKYIQEGKYFGLAVNPSSEGLLGGSGHVRADGMPVIGADGMLKDQYQNPWIWPVATSTHSIMHIMCMDAAARGAKTFAIVYEGKYKFGEEGANSFKGCVERETGYRLEGTDRFMRIDPGQADYGNAASKFVGACKGEKQWSKCDFVAFLLEPTTAFAWNSAKGFGTGKSSDGLPEVGFGAAQPLFVESFARDCGLPCANLRVWTSFKPPRPPYDQEPAVRTYVEDLRAVNRSADASNPHVQGAYVGMQLLVEVLEKMGPAPTREKAKEILDATTFDSGLAPPMTFSSGNHYAAVKAQAFEANYVIAGDKADFNTWQYANTGFKEDTQLREDL